MIQFGPPLIMPPDMIEFMKKEKKRMGRELFEIILTRYSRGTGKDETGADFLLKIMNLELEEKRVKVYIAWDNGGCEKIMIGIYATKAAAEKVIDRFGEIQEVEVRN